MLVGADALVEKKEVALAVAGKQALGTTGLILVTIAAAFSTGSAINATLFSTGRFMETVAKKKDLPSVFLKENQANMPYYALLIISALASVLAVIGSLNALVDAASLIFLVTFAIVNYLSFQQKLKYRIFSLAGAVACTIAIVLSSYAQFQKKPLPLLILLGIITLILIGRPIILKRTDW